MVVALSTLLLTVMFRSVVVAVKAAVMNLLSIAAAYGVLSPSCSSAGWGHLFGFPEPMPITTWVPIFLFVILFGLSMDYEVFLLSRIRENYDATGDNATSVARGLAQTARVITAAAAIMVVVFLSFVLGANLAVKQIGLGLAVAVLIDATLVRMVLVPAVMELLGKANWWLPAAARPHPAQDLPQRGRAPGSTPGLWSQPLQIPADGPRPRGRTRRYRMPVAPGVAPFVASPSLSANLDPIRGPGEFFTLTMIGFPFAELVSYLWRGRAGAPYVRRSRTKRRIGRCGRNASGAVKAFSPETRFVVIAGVLSLRPFPPRGSLTG